jgi:hypothetical protein
MASTASNRRNAVYVKEVTPENNPGKSKPPLPEITGNNKTGSDKMPRPPPRSRPKSWTSTLFNAMRNNHRSVTFQCVLEEKTSNLNSENSNLNSNSNSNIIVATDPTMPLAAASSSDGQKFYSLPRPPAASQLNPSLASERELKLARSRTPSPFRSMIKGLLVKGMKSKKMFEFFPYII